MNDRNTHFTVSPLKIFLALFLTILQQEKTWTTHVQLFVDEKSVLRGSKIDFLKNEYNHVKDLIFLRRYVLIQI